MATECPTETACNQCGAVPPVEERGATWQSKGYWYVTCKTCKQTYNKVMYQMKTLSDTDKDAVKRMMKEDKTAFLKECEGLVGPSLSRYLSVTAKKTEADHESFEWSTKYDWFDEPTVKEMFADRPTQAESLIRGPNAMKNWSQSRNVFLYAVDSVSCVEKSGREKKNLRDITVTQDEKVKKESGPKKIKDAVDGKLGSRKRQQEKLEEVAAKLDTNLQLVVRAVEEGVLGKAMALLGEAGSTKLKTAIAAIQMTSSPDWQGDHNEAMDESLAAHKEAIQLSDLLAKQINAASKLMQTPEESKAELEQKKEEKEKQGASASSSSKKRMKVKTTVGE
jgi:hypothetical protein